MQIFEVFLGSFFVNFFVLGYVGMKPAEGIYLLVARMGLIYYFVFLLLITPFIGRIEKTKKLPLSISNILNNNHSEQNKFQKEVN